ncbi:MAG: hypothetical protein ACREHV_00080 [Rhizomicrobium sp.]
MHVTLTTPEIAAIVAAAVVIVVALVAILVRDHTRSANLRRKYGAAYDRAVRKSGSRRKAEKELIERENRVRHLDIHEIQPAEREQFSERWNLVQSHFVDSPPGALTEADELICSVMKSRGYPASDPDDCAAGIVVNHPRVAGDYRAAQAVRTPTGKRAGKREATTEELRTGLIHYRTLFNELVGLRAGEEKKAA